MNNVEKESWGKFLPSQLNPKALKAFTSLSTADTQTTILWNSKLDAESYLRNFRSQRRRGKESYRHYLVRLKESLMDFYQAKWIKTMEDLTDSPWANNFLWLCLLTWDNTCTRANRNVRRRVLSMPMFIFNLLLTFPYIIPRIQSTKHVDLCTTMLQICNIPA